MKVQQLNREGNNLHNYLLEIHQYIKGTLKYNEEIFLEDESLVNYLLSRFTEFAPYKEMGDYNPDGKHNIRRSLSILSDTGHGCIDARGYLIYDKSKDGYYVTEKFKDYIFLYA